jgi:hypothetical protein
MKRCAAILCLVLATGSAALAGETPSLEVQSGSATLDIQLISEGGNIWTLDPNASSSFTLSNGASFTLNQVLLDIDPSVHYAIGVTNTDGSPAFTPYTFTFLTPTTLTPGLYTVSSSLGGSLTDGGSNGVTLQPGPSGFVQQSFIGSANAGVDLLNTTVSQSATPSTQIFGQYTAGPTIYSLGTTASQISVTTAFNLSDNDSASLSGRFDVVAAVPEPSSYALALLAGGLFAALMFRARRNVPA